MFLYEVDPLTPALSRRERGPSTTLGKIGDHA